MSEPLATVKGSKSRKAPLILLGGFLFLAGVAAGIVAISAFKAHHTIVRPKLVSLNVCAFGQFPPYTPAEQELEKMLHGEDKDIDLALANWLVVADIPQFAGMKREDYFSRLNVIEQLVRQEMARRWKVALSRGKRLDDPETRCVVFCGAVNKLGFKYAEEFAQHDLTQQQSMAMRCNAKYLFLAGMLECERGTCASMPMIYAVLGQRLGLPVHLVSIGQHYFVRWEEKGFRANIESTISEGVYTIDDDNYVQDEGKTKGALTGSEMRNLTNREIVAELFFMRWGHYMMYPELRARTFVDISRAFHLAPETPNIAKVHLLVWEKYHITPQDTLATLKQRQQDLMAAAIAAADDLPRQAGPLRTMYAPPEYQPPAVSQPLPIIRPQPLGMPPQQTPQNIQQYQQQLIQQNLGLK